MLRQSTVPFALGVAGVQSQKTPLPMQTTMAGAARIQTSKSRVILTAGWIGRLFRNIRCMMNATGLKKSDRTIYICQWSPSYETSKHTGAKASPSGQSPLPIVFSKLAFSLAIAAEKRHMAMRPMKAANSLRRAFVAHLVSSDVVLCILMDGSEDIEIYDR